MSKVTRLVATRGTVAPERALRIRVVRGLDAGLERTFESPRVTVGRSEHADLVLHDPTVSQLHAELSTTSLGAVVCDLGSVNGTWCGATKLERAEVRSGAELELGETRLVVERADQDMQRRSLATSFGELVGTSSQIRDLYTLLERLARTELAVLFEGPPGAGKRSAARSLVAAGASPGAIREVDCLAMTPELFAAEIAALQAAGRGTALLVEVLALGPELQRTLTAKLGALGGIRFLSTTTGDAAKAVNAGTFPDELFDRLVQARVLVPSLEARPADVRPLVLHALAKLPFHVTAARAIEPEALDSLARRSYPGNLRELRTVVERLAQLASGASITIDDLAFERMLDARRAASPGARAVDGADADLPLFKEAKRGLVDDFERNYLEKLLTRAGSNISRASGLAGIERQTLRDLLKKHKLRVDDS